MNVSSTTTQTNPVQAAAPSSATTPSTSGSAGGTDQLTNENTFLQLLVAQIKHQDPTNPTDSMQFIGQLVQFSQLEQLLGINQNIQTLVKDVAPSNGTPAPPSGTPSPSSPGTSN
ncbi:MAG TPA: flagellar hook capping FlgD N-terminal domain-containing protein [Bryobacteraceae bacterium]|nr:flagellar hook capping FlgD N-terminal domain-containing protein [Bryobacteraceae bacterium]